jgi:hypothetical protein
MHLAEPNRALRAEGGCAWRTHPTEKGSMPKRTAAAEATTDCKAMIAEIAYFKAGKK